MGHRERARQCRAQRRALVGTTRFSVGNAGTRTGRRDARYSRREAPLEAIDFVRSDGHATVTSFEDRLLFEAVIMAIKNQLTDDQRHVIILRFLEGFSLRETATIIGKEVYNVKVIQNRGVAKLRKALATKVA